jgi:hypothetical protein
LLALRVVDHRELDHARVNAVLDVVHRIGDVVGPVHHLRLEAPLLGSHVGAHPLEGVAVGLVEAELAGAVAARPGVLARGVQARAAQVQPRGLARVLQHLRLEPGEHAQGLRIALEPAARSRDLVKGVLAVVTERRVPDVMGQTGGIDDVRVTAERGADLTSDLRDLE